MTISDSKLWACNVKELEKSAALLVPENIRSKAENALANNDFDYNEVQGPRDSIGDKILA